MTTKQPKPMSPLAIALSIHDLIRYADSEVSISWEKAIGYEPADKVKNSVVAHLRTIGVDAILVGSNVLVHNRCPLKDWDKEYAKYRSMMVKIARRIFDIIRYRLTNQSKWFRIGWNDILDTGLEVPEELRYHVVTGLNRQGFDVLYNDQDLLICADHHDLENPFLTQTASDSTASKQPLLIAPRASKEEVVTKCDYVDSTSEDTPTS